VIVYTGETRSGSLRSSLSSRGIGLVVQRGRIGKAETDLWTRYIFDNLAFSDWKSGSQFDSSSFTKDILSILDLQEEKRPDFSVLPDVVAKGKESLSLSMSWLYRFGRTSIRWALVVQDGISSEDVNWSAPFHTIFVGGSTRWKLDTAPTWVKEAHKNGKSCHIGRVGSAQRVRWARAIGADSIDSSLPLWSEENMRSFLGATECTVQTGWDWYAPKIIREGAPIKSEKK